MHCPLMDKPCKSDKCMFWINGCMYLNALSAIIQIPDNLAKMVGQLDQWRYR